LARQQAERAARQAQEAEARRQIQAWEQQRTQQEALQAQVQSGAASPEQAAALQRQQQEQQRRAEEQRLIQQAEQRRVAQQQQAEQQARNDHLARLAQSENEQRMRDLQARMGGGSSGSGYSGDSSGGGDRPVIAMREGVVVCPLGQDRFFGEITCYGPFQNTLSNPNDEGDIALACGSSSMSPTNFGIRNNNQVWGCGFGLDPTRGGRSPNIDTAERFQLVLPQRRTYQCPAGTDYCR